MFHEGLDRSAFAGCIAALHDYNDAGTGTFQPVLHFYLFGNVTKRQVRQPSQYEPDAFPFGILSGPFYECMGMYAMKMKLLDG